MATFAQHLINAIALGSIFALFALGLAMVYSVLGLLNFAYGEVITVTGYTMFLATNSGIGFWWSIPLGVACGVMFSVLTEIVAFRRLRGGPPYAVLFSSFAVAVIVQNLIRQRISTRPKGLRIPAVFDEAIRVGDLVIPAIALITTLVGIASMAALVLYLQRSRFGLGLRAAADDFATARLMGVRANGVIVLAFVLSGAIGSIAGVLWVARLGSVTPGMGFTPILIAFVATIIGGLGTIRGSVIGGYLLGGFQVMLTAYLPNSLVVFVQAFTMLVVVGFLYFRPQGLVAGPQERLA